MSVMNCLVSMYYFCQEIIQNADDAEATTVKFFIDERSHDQQNLLCPALAKFQGPSLLAYNDAVFTKEDWTNIQKLKRSDNAVLTHSKLGNLELDSIQCFM